VAIYHELRVFDVAADPALTRGRVNVHCSRVTDRVA
jgi:hypothetical protein